MKVKIYLYRFIIAFTAFVCGIGFFAVGRYFQTTFSAKEQKAELTAPVVELTAPAPIIEPAKVPVVEQPIEAVENSEKNAESEFDVDGFYSIIGGLPKGFEDFEEININSIDYETASEENNFRGTIIPPEGYVQAKKEFKLRKIGVSNKAMAFETEKVKSISYKFSGKFIEKAPFWDFDPETPVLEGRLVKSKNGKKVAENNVRLQWYGGGCGC